MENRAHALVAGIFVIFLSITVVLVAMWFGGHNIQRNSYLVVTKNRLADLTLNPLCAIAALISVKLKVLNLILTIYIRF